MMVKMESNIDDKLVNWDRILKELVVDVDELNKDLQDSIRYIGAAGVLVIALGFTVLFYTTRYGSVSDPLWWVMLALTVGTNFVVGLINIRKYLTLSRKYARLSVLQSQLT